MKAAHLINQLGAPRGLFIERARACAGRAAETEPVPRPAGNATRAKQTNAQQIYTNSQHILAIIR